MTRRRLERRWRRTRLTVDRELYTQQCTFVCKLIRGAKERYTQGLLLNFHLTQGSCLGSLIILNRKEVILE